MIELSLIVGLGGIAVAIAVGLARWSLAQSAGTAESSKVADAVVRAGVEFGWRTAGRALGAALAVGLVLVLAGEVVRQTLLDAGPSEAPAGPAGDWHWLLGSALVGALLCLAAGQLSLHIAPRAAARVTTALFRASHAQVVAVGLRSGASIALIADLLALLPSILLLALLHDPHPPTTGQLLQLFGGLSVGALAAAMVAQVSGTAVHNAGQRGRRAMPHATARERYALNVQNPALVLDLMGGHAGVGAVRAQNAFCTSLLAHAACASAALAFTAGSAPGAGTTLWLTLPILSRALGAMASGFVLVSLRADEADEPAQVLGRGQIASGVLSTAGLGGLSVWAAGADWLPWFCAGTLGVVLGLTTTAAQGRLMQTRGERAQLSLGDTPERSGASLSGAVARALTQSWLPLALFAVAALLAGFLGSNTGLAHGGTLALSLLLTGFCMALPYSASLAAFDPIVDSACSLATLDDAHRRPEFQQRALRMNQAALCAGSRGLVHLTLATALIGLLVALILPSLGPALGAANADPLGNTSPHWLLLTAGFSSAALLGFSGAATWHVSRCGEQLTQELGRYVSAWKQAAQNAVDPIAELRPPYNDTLVSACKRALKPQSWYVLGILLCPLALIALGHSLQLPGERCLPVVMLAASAFSSVIGVSFALPALGAWSAVGAQQRQLRSLAESPTHSADASDALAEFAGNVANPTFQLVAKGAVAACLATAPLLF